MIAVAVAPSPWLAQEQQRHDDEHRSRTTLAKADAVALLIDRKLDRISELYRERLEDRRERRGA